MNRNNDKKIELQLVVFEVHDVHSAYVHINGQPVMAEIVDRFDRHGCYLGDLPTARYHPLCIGASMNKVELIQFDENRQGLKITHITNSALVLELALLELENGEYAVSLRLDSPEHARVSDDYRAIFSDLIKTEIDKKFSN